MDKPRDNGRLLDAILCEDGENIMMEDLTSSISSEDGEELCVGAISEDGDNVELEGPIERFRYGLTWCRRYAVLLKDGSFRVYLDKLCRMRDDPELILRTYECQRHFTPGVLVVKGPKKERLYRVPKYKEGSDSCAGKKERENVPDSSMWLDVLTRHPERKLKRQPPPQTPVLVEYVIGTQDTIEVALKCPLRTRLWVKTTDDHWCTQGIAMEHGVTPAWIVRHNPKVDMSGHIAGCSIQVPQVSDSPKRVDRRQSV